MKYRNTITLKDEQCLNLNINTFAPSISTGGYILSGAISSKNKGVTQVYDSCKDQMFKEFLNIRCHFQIENNSNLDSIEKQKEN